MSARLLLILALAFSCAACGFVSRVKPVPVSYAATPPEPGPATPRTTPGAVYRANSGLVLFEDLKASNVGDLVTILLTESTNASKTVSTSTSKDSEIDTGSPTVAGRPVTSGGTPILNNSITGERTFDGQGDASQSNQLNGSITVTIERKLPNGNLVVRGEKWLTLNQGEEFIQVSGIIRPADISTANTVPSTRVADARITYSGKGALASSNRPGWLSRFFSSPWFPY